MVGHLDRASNCRQSLLTGPYARAIEAFEAYIAFAGTVRVRFYDYSKLPNYIVQRLHFRNGGCAEFIGLVRLIFGEKPSTKVTEHAVPTTHVSLGNAIIFTRARTWFGGMKITYKDH